MSDQTIRIHDVEIRNGVTVAGRYEIRGHLGAGGFAQVFEAFDTNIERPVAIKFLNLHATQTDQGASDNILARFKREAKLAARIQHPNVVNIFDFGVIGQNKNIPFIVMEMLSGHDLEEQIFEKGPMKPQRALPLFIACLEALGEAHKADIVHKDLKPSNLFLSNPGTRAESLRIVDFGIAHIQSSQEGRLTATGEILGTPQYLPPEYIESQLVTPAYDIYQMGLILVEALTGAPVVDDNHPLRCVKTHSMGELDLPQPLLESPLGPIIARALHLDHSQRYIDAEAFADALSTVDPSTVPMLGPDTPTARLTQAGTLDSNPQVSGHQTGQMRQPTTGQFGDGIGGHTQDGSAQPAADQQGQRTINPANATEPMHNSTQAAIAEAGIGKAGVKALALLILAVLVVGGVAGWLLVTRFNDEPPSQEPEAVAEAAEHDDDEPDEEEPLEADSVDSEASAAGLAAEGDEEDGAEDDEAPEAEKTEKAEPIEVTIASSTEDAVVYRDGDELGTAPVNIQFDSADAEPVDLEVSRRGYRSKTLSVGPDAGAEVSVALERDVRPKTKRAKPKPKPEPEPEPKPQSKPEPEPSSPQAKAEPADPEKKEDAQQEKQEEKKRQRMLIAP
ncbi:MAG: serine/threonine-protein kinase [Persicimonas sp.]